MLPCSNHVTAAPICCDFGQQVMQVLASRSVLERASVDECYMDVTEAAAKKLQQLRGEDGRLRLPADGLQGWFVCGWVS